MTCARNLAHCLCFLNKVLLEQSYAHAFVYCLWLLLHISRDEQLQQKTCSPQSLSYLPSDCTEKVC